MALTTSEVQRLRYELGYHLLTIGADLYVYHTSLFEGVVQKYLQEGASTTSTTVVPEPNALANEVSLTLASAAGYTVGAPVVIDVDALAETVTVRSVSGNVITVLLTKTHSGTYPVQLVSTGAYTTCSTVVPSLIAPPRSVDIVLADATGFAKGNTVVVDQDARQETATVIGITGNTITLYLNKGHSGTYSVTVEGGESIVRGILQQIQIIAPIGGQYGGRTSGGLNGALDAAGIKKVDEIEFQNNWGSQGASGSILQQNMYMLNYWRDQLSIATGIPRLNKKCSPSTSIY